MTARDTERQQPWLNYRERFDEVDATLTSLMDRWSIPALRAALGIVFVWFGGLKVLGVSPAADLVASTVYVVPADLFVPVLGVWEVLIGICLLYRPLTRVGLLLLALQLPGTFLPLVLLPDVVYVAFPYALTVEGQYIIKNLVIIAAALVIGSTVRDES
ncbi:MULTISPECIES: hypothetical protein [Haloarcula]|uniref:hypothetical protein n=1 Tax=Haloarcula TaxID=2237 RepID=UPI0023E82646|nr:hypothetical protein [Halomicroarcula sp. SHR3]